MAGKTQPLPRRPRDGAGGDGDVATPAPPDEPHLPKDSQPGSRVSDGGNKSPRHSGSSGHHGRGDSSSSRDNSPTRTPRAVENSALKFDGLTCVVVRMCASILAWSEELRAEQRRTLLELLLALIAPCMTISDPIQEAAILLEESMRCVGDVVTGGRDVAVQTDMVKEPDLPRQLMLQAPQSQRDLGGQYALVEGERPNGYPLWKHNLQSFWIYSGTSPYWFVGGAAEFAINFECEAGFLATSRPHDGAMPHKIPSGWQMFDHRQRAWVRASSVWVFRRDSRAPARQATARREPDEQNNLGDALPEPRDEELGDRQDSRDMATTTADVSASTTDEHDNVHLGATHCAHTSITVPAAGVDAKSLEIEAQRTEIKLLRAVADESQQMLATLRRKLREETSAQAKTASVVETGLRTKIAQLQDALRASKHEAQEAVARAEQAEREKMEAFADKHHAARAESKARSTSFPKRNLGAPQTRLARQVRSKSNRCERHRDTASSGDSTDYANVLFGRGSLDGSDGSRPESHKTTGGGPVKGSARRRDSSPTESAKIESHLDAVVAVHEEITRKQQEFEVQMEKAWKEVAKKQAWAEDNAQIVVAHAAKLQEQALQMEKCVVAALPVASNDPVRETRAVPDRIEVRGFKTGNATHWHGVYRLSHSARREGFPLWQHERRKDCKLYSSDCLWICGDGAQKAYLVTRNSHHGQMPNKVTTGWRVFDGRRWADTRDIEVLAA